MLTSVSFHYKLSSGFCPGGFPDVLIRVKQHLLTMTRRRLTPSHRRSHQSRFSPLPTPSYVRFPRLPLPTSSSLFRSRAFPSRGRRFLLLLCLLLDARLLLLLSLLLHHLLPLSSLEHHVVAHHGLLILLGADAQRRL